MVKTSMTRNQKNIIEIPPHIIIGDIGLRAKNAAATIAQADIQTIHNTLNDIAGALLEQTNILIDINQKDVLKAQEKNLSPALIDRLTLNAERINAMAEGVKKIIILDDPVGQILETINRPNGLVIDKVSVPIGVLGMIYESRPNVTIDAAALCLKSRNAVILRGGSESFHSSRALHALIQDCLKINDLPEEAVSMLPSTDRALVGEMLKAHDTIDVMIPRGGKGLTSRVMDEAKMPVFAHLDGNCHIYVHKSAQGKLALDVIKNSKLRRTGICGAAESLLFDSDIDKDFAKEVIKMLFDENCHIVGDETAQKLNSKIQPATKEDWKTEYLDKKISIKFVSNINEAITHINKYGSHHTDAILAEDKSAIQAALLV